MLDTSSVAAIAARLNKDVQSEEFLASVEIANIIDGQPSTKRHPLIKAGKWDGLAVLRFMVDPNDDSVDEPVVAAEEAVSPVTDAVAIPRSESISLVKWDSRCRGWAIVVRADDALPDPTTVTGASSLPQPYARQSGSEELFVGDFVLQGEENHHRKARGWTYRLYAVDTRPGQTDTVGIDPSTLHKTRIRAAVQAGRCAMPAGYLRGAGEVAAMVRIIHALRGGMTLEEIIGTD